MDPTDEQLKQALAKMLPEHIALTKSGFVHWNQIDGDEVKETEWLHLCWLAKQSLTPKERMDCIDNIYQLRHDLRHPDFDCTWQQYTISLAKVKGITP